MRFIVVGFYTDNYKDSAWDFARSCVEHGVPFYLEHIDDKGGWDANTHYKPTFIRECLERFNTTIVYVDVDAKFKRYPSLFDVIDEDFAYWRCDLDFQNHLASGTLLFSKKALPLVKRWEEKCIEDKTLFDQTILENVIREFNIKTFNLPREYCQIFDWPKQSENPVIVHYQASRRHRK